MKNRLLLAVTCLLFLAVATRADSWATPTPRLFTNAWGTHALKVLPAADKMFGPADAVLFTLDEKGNERPQWKGRLVNLPHRVYLSPSTKHIVTIDTYGQLGYQHAVVIYTDGGKVVADYRLEDLVTAAELADKVMKTVSSRHWASGARIHFPDTANSVEIELKWGRTIKIDLETGKLK